jgi:hypothetical protein
MNLMQGKVEEVRVYPFALKEWEARIIRDRMMRRQRLPLWLTMWLAMRRLVKKLHCSLPIS